MQKFALNAAIALALGTALIACGKKEEEAVTPPPAPPAATQKAPAGNAAAAFAAVPAEAQKLGKKPASATACPADAPVKGLVSKERGNYIVTNKNPDYAKKTPNICFKDAATATKAGFKQL